VEVRRLVMGSEIGRDAPPQGAPPEVRAFYSALTLHRRGKLAESAHAWQESGRTAQSLAEKRVVAEAYAEAGSVDQATDAIEALAAVSPIDARFARARLLARSQRSEEAIAELDAAFRGCRSEPWVSRAMAGRALALAVNLSRDKTAGSRLLDALAEPFVVDMLEEQRLVARAQIVHVIDPRCIGIFGALEPWVPWEEKLLERRYDCYTQQGSPLAKKARSELVLFVENRPSKVGAGLLDAPNFRANP
jgi:hypothetical protein